MLMLLLMLLLILGAQFQLAVSSGALLAVTGVCMYVCMIVCMCACMYVCMYVCVHVCMCTCTYVRACVPVAPTPLCCRWSWSSLQSGDTAWGFDVAARPQ